MSNPVIRGLSLTPANVKPGESTTAVVDAFDPDSRTVTVKAQVSDSAGNVATLSSILGIGDPLTYEVTTDDPTVTVVVDPQNPAVFHLAVPA